MTVVDLAPFADGDLDALRVAVLNEQERRRDVAHLPTQIEQLSARYRRAAGIVEAPAATRPTGSADCTSQAEIVAAWAGGIPAWIPEGVVVTVTRTIPSACLAPPAGAYLGGLGTIRMAPAQSTGTRLVHVGEPGVTIEGVTLDLDRPNQLVDGQGHAIYVCADGFTLRNVRAINCPGDGLILSQGTTNATVTGLTTRACRRNGITLYGWVKGVAVDGVTISGCDLEADAQALDAEPEVGAEVRNVTVKGCHLRLPVRAPDRYAISLTGMIDSTVEWCRIEGSVYALGQMGYGPTRVTVRNCTIDGRASTRAAIRGYIHSQDVTFDRCLILAAPGMSAIDMGLSLGEWPAGWAVTSCEVVGSGDAPAINVQGASITITDTTIDAAGGIAVRAWSTRETAVTTRRVALSNAKTGALAVASVNPIALDMDGTYSTPPTARVTVDGNTKLVTTTGALTVTQ